MKDGVRSPLIQREKKAFFFSFVFLVSDRKCLLCRKEKPSILRNDVFLALLLSREMSAGRIVSVAIVISLLPKVEPTF